jgi:hypothetical protein
MQDLVLLQTFLGLSLAIGIVSSGSLINKMCQIALKKFILSRQYVCQASGFSHYLLTTTQIKDDK